jgi:hypothetical protein
MARHEREVMKGRSKGGFMERSRKERNGQVIKREAKMEVMKEKSRVHEREVKSGRDIEIDMNWEVVTKERWKGGGVGIKD